MSEERSAGFVILRKFAGKRIYLLLLHEDGRWDFPKGAIERGETSIMAANRELKEETGIKWVRLIKGFDHRIEYYYRKGSETVHKEVIYYLGEAPDDKITISSEHRGSGWFSYEESMAKMKFDNAKNTLEKVEKFMKLNPNA